MFSLTAQRNLYINRFYHIACEYCCLTSVLQLPALFNCYLSENKVSIVREPGSALLSPNFTERSPAASNQIDCQGSSPCQTELAGTGPNWPDTETSGTENSGSAGWVSYFRICASTMPRAKTGHEKVQFYCEDNLLFLFPIIYLW